MAREPCTALSLTRQVFFLGFSLPSRPRSHLTHLVPFLIKHLRESSDERKDSMLCFLVFIPLSPT